MLMNQLLWFHSAPIFRSDVIGGMSPDQTFNYATNVLASRLTLNLPSNTHPIAAAMGKYPLDMPYT